MFKYSGPLSLYKGPPIRSARAHVPAGREPHIVQLSLNERRAYNILYPLVVQPLYIGAPPT